MPTTPLPTIALPSGAAVPAIGLGTWGIGEVAAQRSAEVTAVRSALEMGYRVIDTAEMYGDGGSESVVGDAGAQALRDGTLARDELFVVSKVLPQHASARAAVLACEASLRRLGLERIDLYLLHWRGAHPLHETVAAFDDLRRRGRIRHWGVSNFDLDDLLELRAVPGGSGCSVNQVYYSLSERGVEHTLLPWQRAHRMPLMAYCPIDGGSLPAQAALRPIAARHDATPAQVALAWMFNQAGVMAIPKAVRADHLRDNLAAVTLTLDAHDLAALDRAFPPPSHRQPLAMR